MCHTTPIMASLLPSNRSLKLISRWQAVPEKNRRKQLLPHFSPSRKPILMQLVDTQCSWNTGSSQTLMVRQLSGVSHSLLQSHHPSVRVLSTADKNLFSILESRMLQHNTAQLVEASYGFAIVLCTAHAKNIQLLKSMYKHQENPGKPTGRNPLWGQHCCSSSRGDRKVRDYCK